MCVCVCVCVCARACVCVCMTTSMMVPFMVCLYYASTFHNQDIDILASILSLVH